MQVDTYLQTDRHAARTPPGQLSNPEDENPSTITAPQQLQHANTCRSTRTNYCKPTAMQPDTPRATLNPEDETPQQSLLRSNCNMPTHAGRHVRTIANRPPCSRTPPGQLSNPEDEPPLNNHCSAATATCQHMQVDSYELLQTDHHAAGHPQGNFQTPKMKPPQQSLLRSNCNMPTHAGRHVRTIANRPPCSRTPPGQLSNPEDECTHTSFPEAKIPPHSPFATRITRYNTIQGKTGPKCSQCRSTLARMLRLSSQKERHHLRLEISTEQQVTLVQDEPSTKVN